MEEKISESEHSNSGSTGVQHNLPWLQISAYWVHKTLAALKCRCYRSLKKNRVNKISTALQHRSNKSLKHEHFYYTESTVTVLYKYSGSGWEWDDPLRFARMLNVKNQSRILWVPSQIILQTSFFLPLLFFFLVKPPSKLSPKVQHYLQLLEDGCLGLRRRRGKTLDRQMSGQL